MNGVTSSLGSLSVYIIEPQVLLAKAISAVLAQDGEFAKVTDSRSFDAASFQSAAADVGILDVDDNLANLERVIADCRTANRQTRICVISAYLSSELMLRAIAAGADGYVVKDTSPADLIRAIRTIVSDGFHADGRLAGALLRQRATRARGDVNELSPRELQIVRLIVEGLSNKEIGQRLMLSDKTVKNHVSKIFAKMRVNARTQLVIRAMRTGLV